MSKISVIICCCNENSNKIKLTIESLSLDSYISEVIIVDDCSLIPVCVKNAKIVRNTTKMGMVASKFIGVSMAQSPYILTTNVNACFKTKSWGKLILESLLDNPKNVVCPSLIPSGSCPFKGKLYGGSLDIISSRRMGVVVLEPRWNTELKETAECVMGGTYAFNKEWNTKIGGYTGVKGLDQTELISLSLKTRLSGGNCKVLKNVEMEYNSTMATQTEYSTYNKLRLSTVLFPPEVSTIIPAILYKNNDFQQAISSFMSDFSEIVAEKDSFWSSVGNNQEEAARIAGIDFGVNLGNKQ